MSNNNNKTAAASVSASEEVKGFWSKLWGRGEQKVETAEEKASKLVEGYKVPAALKNQLIDKVAEFQEETDIAKAKSEADINSANGLVENALSVKEETDEVLKATKAVGLRLRTLAVEMQTAKDLAEKAKAEAKAKVEQINKETESVKAEADALLEGVLSPMLTIDKMLQMTEEEVQSLFGSPKQEPKKAPDLGGV